MHFIGEIYRVISQRDLIRDAACTCVVSLTVTGSGSVTTLRRTIAPRLVTVPHVAVYTADFDSLHLQHFH